MDLDDPNFEVRGRSKSESKKIIRQYEDKKDGELPNHSIIEEDEEHTTPRINGGNSSPNKERVSVKLKRKTSDLERIVGGESIDKEKGNE